MENLIFETSWQERQRFENELLKIAPKEISLFEGHLMSWSNNNKQPYLSPSFIEKLSDDEKNKVQELIDSLR